MTYPILRIHVRMRACIGRESKGAYERARMRRYMRACLGACLRACLPAFLRDCLSVRDLDTTVHACMRGYVQACSCVCVCMNA